VICFCWGSPKKRAKTKAYQLAERCSKRRRFPPPKRKEAPKARWERNVSDRDDENLKLSFPAIKERRRPIWVDVLLAWLGGILSAISYDNWPAVWALIVNYASGVAGG
jgi:hypothetical protein